MGPTNSFKAWLFSWHTCHLRYLALKFLEGTIRLSAPPPHPPSFAPLPQAQLPFPQTSHTHLSSSIRSQSMDHPNGGEHCGQARCDHLELSAQRVGAVLGGASSILLHPRRLLLLTHDLLKVPKCDALGVPAVWPLKSFPHLRQGDPVSGSLHSNALLRYW